MIRNRKIVFCALLLLGVVFIGYIVYPQAMMIRESLLVNGRLSFDHYREVLDFSNSANAEAIVNSVIASLLTVGLGAIVGGVLALTFTQFRFPSSKLLSVAAAVPFALPPLVGVISFLFVFGESGLLPRLVQRLFMLERVPFYLDGFWAIVAVQAYSFNVYFYLLVSNSFRQLDGSLAEAASSLGSSQWKTLRQVLLPQLRPAFAGASVLTFMASMASFSAPLIFGGDRRFLTTRIYATKLNGDMDQAAAQSVLLTLVSVGFFLALTFSNWSRGEGGKMKGTPRGAELRVSPLLRNALILATVLIVLLELLPIVSIVLISFVKESTWTWQLFPTEYTTENYLKLLNDPRIFQPIENSILMTVLTLIAAVIVGGTASIVVVKGGLGRLRGLVDILLTFSYAIPGTVVAISLIAAFNRPTVFGGHSVLVGTFWIMPLAYFIRTYPLVVRATSAALEHVDDSLMEAGETFGAGFVRRVWKIMLPLILPGVVSGCLLVAIASLGEFVSSILLYTYSSRSISIEILSQLRGYNFGAASAYSVFLLVIILILSSLVSRVGRRRDAGGLTGNLP